MQMLSHLTYYLGHWNQHARLTIPYTTIIDSTCVRFGKLYQNRGLTCVIISSGSIAGLQKKKIINLYTLTALFWLNPVAYRKFKKAP